MGTYDKEIIAKTLINTTFLLDDAQYVFAKIDPKGLKLATEIFNNSKKELRVLSTDRWEITLIISKDELTEDLDKYILEKQTVSSIYCDTHPDWPTCTGYLLKIVESLSPANVGVYVIGAYRSDHILVDVKDADRAMDILLKMQQVMGAQI